MLDGMPVLLGGGQTGGGGESLCQIGCNTFSVEFVVNSGVKCFVVCVRVLLGKAFDHFTSSSGMRPWTYCAVVATGFHVVGRQCQQAKVVDLDQVRLGWMKPFHDDDVQSEKGMRGPSTVCRSTSPTTGSNQQNDITWRRDAFVHTRLGCRHSFLVARFGT